MIRGSKIALLACGSFNPPTNLHFRMMERAKDFLEVEHGCHVVTGIMSPVADHFGKKDLVSSVHRFRMLELGSASSHWIKPDNWECSRNQWTRTLEVLRHHQEKAQKTFGNDTKLMLVCGGDMVDSFQRILPNGKFYFRFRYKIPLLLVFHIFILQERTSGILPILRQSLENMD